MKIRFATAALGAALMLSACGASDTAGDDSVGANPQIPNPNAGALPTIQIAKPIGWTASEAPTAPAGFSVSRYAEGLHHPRNLHVLPNGDVLVVQANKVEHPPADLEAWIAKHVMAAAGAGVASANEITLLRGVDAQGRAVERHLLIKGLVSPFGVAYADGYLYVADTDAVVRFPYKLGDPEITAKPQKVADLPANAPNDHWTRDLALSADGKTLYVSVGSDSNIADHGLEAEQGRALILAMNLDGSGKRVFASGLRNANGLTIQPGTNQLWAVVNERDMLGNDTPPDYLVAVKDGGFYGWPWSYWGQHVDARVKPPRPDMVQKAIAPDYALGGHVAPLGLAFYTGASFPEPWRSGAYIGEHGSWNRKPPSGYKVAFVTFEHGRPTGLPKDFLTGFLNAKGETHGRPVGVAVDSAGALLVADDVGDIVWRVAAKPAK